MQIKKQWLEPDMEWQTYSKLGKEYIKAVYCHPAYLTSLQSVSCEMPGWINHRLISRLPGEISTTFRYADDTTLMAESEEKLKSLLMKVKEESEKAALKLNIQRTKTLASYPIPSWHIGGEKVEGENKNPRFYFLGVQNHCGWTLLGYLVFYFYLFFSIYFY